MLGNKKIAGARGEDLAVSYLKTQRYRIIERNFRTRNGEIDIIAIDQAEKPPVLCFIEVKTRTSLGYGTPLESIGYFKLAALRRTANVYVLLHPDLPDRLRIDAISVFLNQESTLPEIELVKNIS